MPLILDRFVVIFNEFDGEAMAQKILDGTYPTYPTESERVD